MAWSQAKLQCLKITWSQYQPTSPTPTHSVGKTQIGGRRICAIWACLHFVHTCKLLCNPFLQPMHQMHDLFMHLVQVRPMHACKYESSYCLWCSWPRLFKTVSNASLVILFTGISLGWFGFISSFFKYYRGKFGVISFVASLYEQFYCTLWGSSSTSGLQIWYFSDFYIKSHHGGQELLHKSKDFYHWDLELFIFPSLLYYFNPIFLVSSCILSSLCLC